MAFSGCSFGNEKLTFKGELELGFDEDSTVIIDDVDRIQNIAGFSRNFRLFGNFEYNPDEQTTFAVGYHNIVKDYHQDNDFDSRLHILSMSYSHDFEGFSAGVRSQGVRSDLASQKFLTMAQVSPYLSFFIGKQWYLNLSYRYAEKVLITSSARSGESHEVGADLYRFIQGINHYLLIDVDIKHENTNNALFHYDATQLRLGWVRKFDAWGKSQKLRLNWRYQRRKYDEVEHPDINEIRLDNRRHWEFNWELHLTTALQLNVKVHRNEQGSRLPGAIYDQTVKGLSLQYEF